MDLRPINDKQQLLLEQLRDQCQDVLEDHHDDYFLFRYLKAREFNVHKAEKMVRMALQWRTQWHCDNILQEWEPPEVLERFFAQGILGMDKDGIPVWLLPLEGWDLRGLLRSVRKSDFIRHTIYKAETGILQAKIEGAKRGRQWPDERQCIIIDMEGFSLRQVVFKNGMEMVGYILNCYEAYYPEYLKVAYVINAPRMFNTMFAMIKPFLHEKTMKKIRVFGTSSKKWQKELLKDIDADVLPAYLGGTRIEGGDPRCKSLICYGGDVPISYYYRKDIKPEEFIDDNMAVATLGRQGTLRVELTATKPGSLIRWEFRTEGGPVSFSIILREPTGDEVDVLPQQTVSSHEVPEQGLMPCTELGTYVFIFDNSSEKKKDKKLLYTVSIAQPKGTDLEEEVD